MIIQFFYDIVTMINFCIETKKLFYTIENIVDISRSML